MDFKTIVFCASALLVQSISGQNCGRVIVPSCPSSIPISSPVSNNGGSLIITSLGPIAPYGIAIASELDLQGDLEVCGALPYKSAVEFAANLPTSGSGVVDYSCGTNTPVTITAVTGGSPNGCSCLY